MTDLLDLTIAQAGDGLRTCEFTSRDLTAATLRRIAQTEPRIHAYAYVYEAEAPEVALERDRELKAGRPRGPLHGVPIAIKDLLYTTDAPTEAGCVALKGF